jgi:hypothetical protein
MPEKSITTTQPKRTRAEINRENAKKSTAPKPPKASQVSEQLRVAGEMANWQLQLIPLSRPANGNPG